MRAAAIFGLGCSPRDLKPFQDASAEASVATWDWRIGLPAAADQADVILLFGGDGTIHRHLPQLMKLGLPVLVAPVGSGNDFARALGLRSVRDSLAAWRGFCATQANIQAIDLGVVSPLRGHAVEAPSPQENDPARNSVLGTRRFFGCVAGIGLDAEVARRANTLPSWLRGHGGYALTLAPAIFRFAPFPLKILAFEEGSAWNLRSDQPTMLAAFANTSTYGGGMQIAPRARFDDGQLDVCVIGGIDPFKLFCLFPTVYSGRHLSIRGVEYFQGRRFRLETETPFDVYADGEYVCRTPVEIAAEPAALRVICRPDWKPETGN